MRHRRRLVFSTGAAALAAALSLGVGPHGGTARAQVAPPGPATRADPATPSPQTALPTPQPGAGDRGVITPPSSVAPGMTTRPPAGGGMPVIPPPGSPGGDRGVTPK